MNMPPYPFPKITQHPQPKPNSQKKERKGEERTRAGRAEGRKEEEGGVAVGITATVTIIVGRGERRPERGDRTVAAAIQLAAVPRRHATDRGGQGRENENGESRGEEGRRRRHRGGYHRHRHLRCWQRREETRERRSHSCRRRSAPSCHRPRRPRVTTFEASVVTVIAAASGSVTVKQSRRFWVRHRHCFLRHRRPWSSSPPESQAEVGEEAIFLMLMQSPCCYCYASVVSAFDSIKFDVAVSVIGVGDVAIVPVVLESPLLL
ncbi:uncharacterized protein LOC110265236 [Arachis ipaensis]|uniref:uncharacterized protein LOC110265236 n=1 Tax=Arachis ipaensis TaxID=130454 RepID=UPI000A2B53C8|nr:uncharacterized protein LOC110265236 [Arachis ipaensis]